jgi:cytochrome c oxidase subunit 3
MGTDWAPTALPPIVWINTGLLALSSVMVEAARRAALRGSPPAAAARWLGGAGLLGLLFLTGQIAAWTILARQGVFLASSPHAAFFYVLSGVHGAHVLGGLGALAWTRRRAVRSVHLPRGTRGLTYVAIYWHFVGAVWVYLLLLLSIL